MKLPVKWLADFIDVDAIGVDNLANRLTMAGLEVEEIEEGPGGPVFVTKVTPNRGDWLSIEGVVREAAAASVMHGGIALRPSKIGGGALPPQPLPMPIRVDDSVLCPRYAAMIVEIDSPGTSPDWMQERLTAAGIRPINAVVDSTNYVMLELGQPLHAFDLDKLAGNEIIVRPARPNEILVTLDGKARALPPHTLVIADRAKPIAIAGIMGGQDTEVTAATKRVLLESAHFNPMAVRAASKALGLTTDASYRFERYVDPTGVPRALLAAAQLIAAHAGGKIVPASSDLNPKPYKPKQIDFRINRAESILGIELRDGKPYDALKALGFVWTDALTDTFDLTVQIPSHRPDIMQEIDVIEELGRMVGYERLPETLPPARSTHGGGRDSTDGVFCSRIRACLIEQGLTEIFSHTLSAPSAFDDPAQTDRRVAIRTALSAELSGLRQSLIPTLLESFGKNARLRNADINLFEIGKVFWKDDVDNYVEGLRAAVVMNADYLAAKGVLENFYAALGLGSPNVVVSTVSGMHPNRCAAITLGGDTAGFIAEVDPDKVAEHLDTPPSIGRIACFELDCAILAKNLPPAARYRPLPKFPEVTRDLAILFDLDVPYGRIEQVTRANAGEFLEDINLMSIYTGERVESGKKSVAIRLELRSPDRTLTDADADSALQGIQRALGTELKGIHR